MSLKKARLRLLTLFVVSLVAHFIVLAYTYFVEAIYAEDFESLVLQILTVYSVPLGIILGAFFGQSKLKKRSVAPSVFHAALALSILWNGLLLVRTLVFGFAQNDHAGDYAGFQERISKASLFLIAGALAFFFTKAGTSDE